MSALSSLDSWLMNPEVLERAAHHVAQSRGGATPGVDGVSGTHLTPADRRSLAQQVAREVKARTYRPSPLRRFTTRERGKPRLICVATFGDRVLQTALMWGMGYFLEPAFAAGNYGVRGAGPQRAVSDAVEALSAANKLVGEAGQVHFVSTDVAGYFDSIPHAPLRSMVRRYLSGRRTPRLLALILEQGQRRPGFGLAQGAPLSPLLANLYLNEVDRYFDRRKPLFSGRFIDDMLMVVPGDHEEATANLRELDRQVRRLGLELNRAKTLVAPATQGVDFLGFRLCLNAQGVEVTPNERSLTRLQRRLEEVPDDGNLSVNLHAATAAWAAYFTELAPQAFAMGDRLAKAEFAARLLRRPVAKTPAIGTGVPR